VLESRKMIYIPYTSLKFRIKNETVHLYRKLWLFRRELPAPGRGIYEKNGILLGTTGSWTRNPLEEWNSAGNYWFLDEESIGRMKFYRELLAPGH
jgi:hypothetical protein